MEVGETEAQEGKVNFPRSHVHLTRAEGATGTPTVLRFQATEMSEDY